jgi:hypothetical protein
MSSKTTEYMYWEYLTRLTRRIEELQRKAANIRNQLLMGTQVVSIPGYGTVPFNVAQEVYMRLVSEIRRLTQHQQTFRYKLGELYTLTRLPPEERQRQRNRIIQLLQEMRMMMYE